MTMLTPAEKNELDTLHNTSNYMETEFQDSDVTPRQYYIFLSIDALSVAETRNSMSVYKNINARALWVADLIINNDPVIHELAKKDGVDIERVALLLAKSAVGCEFLLGTDLIEKIRQIKLPF